MKKKKRRTPLPRGFGSIRQLSGRRRNPWAVYPPVTEWTEAGSPITPKALAYVSTWQKGFVILQAWHAGTYTPELITMLDIPALEVDDPQLQAVIDRMLNDYRIIHNLPVVAPSPTFREIHTKWYDWKFMQDKSRTYSQNYILTANRASDILGDIVDKPIGKTTKQDWQAAIDALDKSHDTVVHYVRVVKEVFRYGVAEGLIDADLGADLRATQAKANRAKGEIPAAVIKKMWAERDDETVKLILILCYTGLRIEEARDVQIDLAEKTMTGGSKTKAGKNRVIPIHSGILPLITRTDGLYEASKMTLYTRFKAAFQKYGIPEASAHWCRHTFATMCERYDVNPMDAKRMLGHSIGDITAGVYSHRKIEDLRQQIEKIPAPSNL